MELLLTLRHRPDKQFPIKPPHLSLTSKAYLFNEHNSFVFRPWMDGAVIVLGFMQPSLWDFWTCCASHHLVAAYWNSLVHNDEDLKVKWLDWWLIRLRHGKINYLIWLAFTFFHLMIIGTLQIPLFFQLQSLLSSLFLYRLLFLISLLLVLKWRMAHCCAAVLQTRRCPRAQVWFYTQTWQAMANAESPSCTALTATTNCHQSPCLETLPLLENCELFPWQRDSVSFTMNNCVFLCITVFAFTTSHFRHGEDLIVTPFAQVRADY